MYADCSKELLADLQADILEMIAFGEPAAAVADLLCLRAQAAAPGVICSVLTVDRDRRLRPLAAPGLPAAYSAALDGLAIGPMVGSCGTAAFRGEPVEVHDIAHDPLWHDYKALALPLGLKACWSSPIKARDGRVIGTFAFYFRKNRGPDAFERQIVERCTHLCAIAIEHEEMLKRINDMAFVDMLSGLANRASFTLRIRQLCDASEPFALFLIDLDHLKTINDTLGHFAGDALICAVAARLKAFGSGTEAFRLGGDEFAIVLPGCATDEEMGAAALLLIDAVSRPVHHFDHTIAIFVTVGGVLRSSADTDADTLCQNADFALYHGKAMNRGGFVPFREDLRTAIRGRIQAIADVGEAIEEDRLLAHYQPIVLLETAEIVGLEALARIANRDGSVRAAGDFQQALSDSRLAHRLTGKMLAVVAHDLRGWIDLGIPFQHVGFNVTVGDFQRGDLESRITTAFAEAGVPLHHIILEVNEAVFMGGGDNHVARAVERLRAKGLRVALDDFGTGFASLTHLLNFPVDIIKIDKSFVDRILDDRQSVVIVEALVDIARKLDMRLVAEGIETPGQAERLLELGCPLGQGYLFARPTSAATTTELLRRFAQRGEAAARQKPALPYRFEA